MQHPQAWMVRQMGYVAARYRGLNRNAMDFSLSAIAYNLKRSVGLQGRPSKPELKQQDR